MGKAVLLMLIAFAVGVSGFASQAWAEAEHPTEHPTAGVETASTEAAPAEAAPAAEMVTVYQCPMDTFTSEEAGNCPLCGMKMEETQLTAADAQAALDAAKEKMKGRA